MKRAIPYGRQEITLSDVLSVLHVLRTKNLTQGEEVPRFEEEVANAVGCKYASAVNSATSALHITCMAMGLEKGDYLWTSPITFVASANCGRYCGANVDFVDIDTETGLMSVEKLKEKLELAKVKDKLPKIVVVVHFTGTPCEMSEINKLAKEYKFKIIEDASHAIGAKYRGKDVGSCIHSNATIFSFHPVKIITTGEGGMITTNDKNLKEKVDLLRNHGITKKIESFIVNKGNEWEYEQQLLGYNYRMTDIAAALGRSQLKRLKSYTKKRNRQLKVYSERIDKNKYELLKIPEGCNSSVHLGIIKCIGDEKSRRDILFKELRKQGIGVQVHYTPVHLQPYYRQFGFKEGDFPNAEAPK